VSDVEAKIKRGESIQRILTASGFLGTSTPLKALFLLLFTFGVLWFATKARPRIQAARKAECRQLYAVARTSGDSLRVDMHIPQPLSQDLMGNEMGTPPASRCRSYR
jgi:hypothetical protein